MSKEQDDWQTVTDDWQTVTPGADAAPSTAPKYRAELLTPDFIKGNSGYIRNPLKQGPVNFKAVKVRDEKGQEYTVQIDPRLPIQTAVADAVRNDPRNQPSAGSRLASTPLDMIPGMEGQTLGTLASGVRDAAVGPTTTRTQRAMQIPAQLVVGAGKDVASTGYEILKNLQQQGKDAGFGPPIMGVPEQKPGWMTPTTPDQKVGAMGSTIAQFAIPSAEVGKIPEVAALGTAGRAAVEAAISGGVSHVRGDDATTALANAATAGGLTAFGGWLAGAGTKVGERVEIGLLKPLKTDVGNVNAPPEVAPQTLIKNLFKYDLGGTLPQSLTKATAKTKDLAVQLKAALAANPAAKVDVLQVLADTTADLQKAAPANWGTNSAMQKVADNLMNELHAINPSGVVDLADAQQMKQAVGAMGAWKNGMQDAESTATETFANAVYTKMKTAIEQASGQSQQVKDINAQFSDIIPIKNALIRRIPVAARRDPIGLKQAVGLASGGWAGLGLAGADQLLRSGTFANMAVQAAKRPGAAAARVVPGMIGAKEAVPMLMTPPNVPTTIQKK